MTKEEASAYITAAHIYYDVAALEAVNCPVNKYLTEIDGKTLLGTDTPYTAISAKELLD